MSHSVNIFLIVGPAIPELQAQLKSFPSPFFQQLVAYILSSIKTYLPLVHTVQHATLSLRADSPEANAAMAFGKSAIACKATP